jgi:uncharacterized protein YdhG (YjbR/CyaY superfamily)
MIFPISVPILIFLFVKRRDNQNVVSASQQKWQNALRVIEIRANIPGLTTEIRANFPGLINQLNYRISLAISLQ